MGVGKGFDICASLFNWDYYLMYIGDIMFNWFTYLIAIIQIIAGLLIIKFNKNLEPQKSTSENDSMDSQIPMIGIILIGLGDLILIIILLISGR